jgi:aspartyl-tRNA(Asn)/glutamyl-tRNA(Gln) amidotransferase subunit B
VPPAALAELVDLVEKGTLSGKPGKDVFGRMWQDKRRAADIVAAESVSVVSDTAVIEEGSGQRHAYNLRAGTPVRSGSQKRLRFSR